MLAFKCAVFWQLESLALIELFMWNMYDIYCCYWSWKNKHFSIYFFKKNL